ncbi:MULTISPECIES: TonB-dependent receptor family protein [Luteimonas]|uniref:TonB-dependent receptor family protein n=1 Tax=Luteimonas TaxID=83614 RepID=UPI000C7B0125|nr:MULTISPECIES: TonB-dependent receptor [Luteimonas]
MGAFSIRAWRAPLALALALALVGVAPLATAAEPVTASGNAEPVTLGRVRVDATRLRSVSGFDTPASVDTIRLDSDVNRAESIASEPLNGVPGLLARDRQNHAQDTQLSIRGFGARSTFGVRGVRLFADGIPASMPDGQGQLSHFNLVGGDRIDVIRGPFSALYGNSSGGVVQLWSADGQPGDPWRFKASAGSDATTSVAAQLRGGDARIGYNVALSRFDTDGYRDHSAARRDSLNAKVRFDFGARRTLDLVANALDLPEAQDPLGLTAAQVRENPRQATAVATQFNTRKSVRQQQGGAVYEHGLGEAQTLRAMFYAGEREVVQYLPIPAVAQANPLNAGGVIDLDNRYGGIDLRWSWEGELAGRPLELTIGANADRQRQHRQGFENFAGAALGVRGALRRDERNSVDNRDQFAQVWWTFAPRWSLLAGVRHSEVTFDSDDDYVTAANPDDSGGVRYRQTSPVAGLMFSAREDLRLYLSAGRGFETPTFNELGYRADGGAGLALDLQPAISDNVELGAKWRGADGATLDAALFRADTDDELAVARNVGGRSSFQNIGQARRQGLEAAWRQPLGATLDLQLAYTWLDATFRNDYLICSGVGCTVPATPVATGARIPGVARQQLFARLQWDDGTWGAAVESVGLGDVVANDTGEARAPGHVLLHVEGSRRWGFASGQLRTFARLDNVFDKAYIGSVIVNEGNGRFYEPAPGRGVLVGAQWTWNR